MKTNPIKTPCGGLGVYAHKPVRHWCRMTDEDMALHVLAGLRTIKAWGELHSRQETATAFGGKIAMWHRGAWHIVRLNSQCTNRKEPHART